MLVYKLSGCWFESSCSYWNLRYCACFEQGVLWHSGNYRVWIHSETRTWDDNNIQPWKLLEDLRDGDTNPKEVLKNEPRLKLDLNEIKTGGKKSPHQKHIIKNITVFFDLREKNIDFFRDCFFFCYLKLSTKQNMEKNLKY